jgi:AcrR family transcriptional regulator
MQVNLKARAAAAEKKRARTRARLIDAAMRVIADRGPGAVTVSDIAAESGLSRGAFYNYFPTPDDLLDAVSEKMRDDLRGAAADAGLAARDPAEQLARACLHYCERAMKDPIWGWVWLQTDASSRTSGRVINERFETLFYRAVELGQFRAADPAAAAAVAFGSVRMAVRLALTRPEAPASLYYDTLTIVLMGLGMSEPAAVDLLARAGWRRD